MPPPISLERSAWWMSGWIPDGEVKCQPVVLPKMVRMVVGTAEVLVALS